MIPTYPDRSTKAPHENEVEGKVCYNVRYKKDVHHFEEAWTADQNRMKMRFALLRNDVLEDEEMCFKCHTEPATSKCVSCNVGLSFCDPCLALDHMVLFVLTLERYKSQTCPSY